MDKSKTIGMVGVGLMGHGIAANVRKHGYPLVFLDHPGNQPTHDLLQAGARAADSLAAIAAAADAIILCVTGTPQVEDVLYGAGGLIKHLRPETVIIDCSTAIPSSSVKIAKDVAGAHGRFLDAPMTRTPKEAALGRLNLIVGGDRGLFEECRPLLASFAENITYAGESGAGHRMKLIHNFVSLGFSAVLAEAAACARRAKIDDKILLDILQSGAGRGVVLDRFAPYISAHDDSGLRFSLANACKDLGYYTTMAEEAKAPCRVARAVQETFGAGMRGAASPNASVPTLLDVLEKTQSPAQ